MAMATELRTSMTQNTHGLISKFWCRQWGELQGCQVQNSNQHRCPQTFWVYGAISI